MRVTTTLAGASAAAASPWSPSTNQVDPLPASTGRKPVARSIRSRHSPSRGSTWMAAGSRSLPLSPVGPRSSSHVRYTPGVEMKSGGITTVNVRADERQRLHDLADASDAGPPSDQAERDVRSE